MASIDDLRGAIETLGGPEHADSEQAVKIRANLAAAEAHLAAIPETARTLQLVEQVLTDASERVAAGGSMAAGELDELAGTVAALVRTVNACGAVASQVAAIAHAATAAVT